MQKALSGLCSPVNEQFEILELPYSETVLAPEGEHRNRSSGTAPRSPAEHRIQVTDHYAGVLRRNFGEEMVRAGFPTDREPGLGIEDDELILERFLDIEENRP